MAKYHGRKGKIYISSDGGTTRDKIVSVVDLAYEVSAPEIDVSDHDTEGWTDSINDLKKWSATASVNMHSPTPSTHAALRDAIVNETEIFLAIYEHDEGAGEPEATGYAIVTNLGPNLPSRGAATMRLQFAGRGALSFGTQS